jgi:signal transduction histidine kinase
MFAILSATWAYVRSFDRALPVLLCALLLAGATSSALGAETGRPHRVLVVHSFGSSAPPFTTHSTAFESAIKREFGADAIDLDEISLNMARYAQPDIEEAFAEFLGKRMSKWQPDLVVPIGSPAGKFVAKYRDTLFLGKPVVYTGMDRRTLPADAFANNATFVGESFDLKGIVEQMLHLDPKTNHIVVILGATPLERYWATEFKKAFEPFAGRVKFTWANDLSFEQMLDLVSTLPPHSFVLLGLLIRDASGVTYNEHAALARLHAVSRAPINGLFQNEVGLGIVGGRLYQGELQGIESARVAARILRGEPASSFPPLVIPAGTPTYDWRELKRWGISESRLPTGSTVLFREPTAWELYRWHVVMGVGVIATQAALISGLLVQRRRRNLAELARNKAQVEVQQKRAQLEHVARVATLGELTATLTHELKQPLNAIRANTLAGLRFLDDQKPDLREVRETLTDIRDITQRAGDVIQALRDMLKRDTPGLASVDVNQLVRSVERILHSDAVQHRVRVELDLSPGVVPIKGDGVQLQQVVLNLMLNGFHAMSDPSLNGAPRRLVVRTRSVNGSNVLVEVRDNGTGIPEEQLESIFEPFVTSKRDGLGMGLSICRTIVERHGGKLWAANNSERGATFSITLPATHDGTTPHNI